MDKPVQLNIIKIEFPDQLNETINKGSEVNKDQNKDHQVVIDIRTGGMSSSGLINPSLRPYTTRADKGRCFLRTRWIMDVCARLRYLLNDIKLNKPVGFALLHFQSYPRSIPVKYGIHL